ncbi:YadA-like family protein [Histophilus somni]
MEKEKRKKDPRIALNKEGTAVGYRSFARGEEATALGNDVMAWGDSSISIGSDNVAGQDAKPLSKEMFRLFYNVRDDFNYTKEYAAVDFEIMKDDRGQPMLNDKGQLLAEDNETISRNGVYFVRADNKTYDKKGYYRIQDGKFYFSAPNAQYLTEIDPNTPGYEAKIKEIKSLSDYKRYELYLKKEGEAYQKYLADHRNTKTHTWARGNNAIAIGARSIAYGDNSTALGTFAVAAKDYSTAIGSNTVAFGKGSLVMGNNSYVYADGSVGIGNKVQAIGAGSMVYGKDSFAGGLGSLAIGDHTFANVKMGNLFNGEGLGIDRYNLLAKDKKYPEYANDTQGLQNNKITIEDLYRIGDTAAIQDIMKEHINAHTTVQEGTGEEKAEQSKDKLGRHNQGAIAIGSYSVALGDNAISLGRYAYAKEDSTVALGRFAFAQKESSFSIGNFTRALGKQSVAFGTHSLVKADDSMALGIKAKVLAEMPTALRSEKNKKNSKPDFTIKNAMAIGNGAEASFSDSIALGVNAKTDYTQTEMAQGGWAPKNAISIPSSERIGYLSVGGKNAERRIVNVAPGASDTDAVNVSQLRALEEAILYGNTLEEDNINSGVKYVSVKGLDDLKLLVTKEQDYKNYIKIKREYLKLKARKEIGEETINTDELDAKLKKYETRYSDFSAKSSKLQQEYDNPAYSLLFPSSDTEEDKKRKRKDRLKSKIDEIEKAYADDEKVSVLTMAEKEKIKNSNFNSDRAKKSGSMAIGVGALANSDNSIVIGQNAKIENDKAHNTVLLGNNTSSNFANAVALGNYSVADRPAEKFTQAEPEAYINDELAKAIGGETYAAVSVGKNGGNISEIQEIVKAKKEFDKWVQANKSSPDQEKYTKEKAEKEATLKKLALRKITNVAPGTKDTDVVILAQLKEAMKGVKNVGTLHYLSVNNPTSKGSNYDNDGAKGSNSVAIGVDAGTDKNASAGIAIGKGASSKAQNAIVIGTNVSVDVPNSFVLGSDNKVETTADKRRTNDAVVVMGSGTTIKNSWATTAIGAVKASNGKHIKNGTPITGAYIENAPWATVIGNKSKVYNGTDIIALANNIEVNVNKADFDTDKNANDNLVIIGNKAKAARAKDSVVIGSGAKALTGDEKNHAYEKVEKAVSIGQAAVVKATGAVALGQGATVETAAGNSIALGQGSEATKKETALNEAKIEAINVKFNFKSGVSANGQENNKKSVLSIGKKNNERIIKHVAAGAVTSDSTDAINGSQLYAVADEFSKLAVNVLGAEVEDANKTGFKKSEFTALLSSPSTNPPQPQGQTQKTAMTFKDAIEANIAKLNSGFVFGSGDESGEQGTHYLGDKLIIKAGAVDKPSTTQDGGYVPDNIKTAYQSKNKTLLIGIKENPTFKKVTLSEEQTYPSDSQTNTVGKNDLITKGYLEGALANVASSFTVKGDTPSSGSDASLEINKTNTTLNIKGGNNITTAVDDSNKALTISLKEALTDITSITGKNGNGGSAVTKIEFTNGDTGSGTSTSPTVKITADGGEFTFGKDELNLNSKQITGITSGLEQKMDNGASGRQDLDELLKLVATGQPQNGGTSNDGKLKKAINAGDLLHVANELKNKGLSFQGNSDDDKVTRKLGETLKIVGETSSTGSTQTTETAAGNITVAKKNGTTNEADTLEIKLSKNLKGIGSVANGDDIKIELKTTGTSGSNTKSIVFTAGDNSKSVTLTGDKFSGVSEISKGNAKLTLNDQNTSLELGTGKSKLELKENETTITAGTDAGSINITNNGDKKIELSPESGATLTLKKSGDKVQISGLSSGLTDVVSSTDTGTSNNKLDELLKLKPQSSGTQTNQEKLNRAVNVEDLLDIAQGLVDRGLTFKVANGTSTSGSDTETTKKLGETLTFKGGKHLTASLDSSKGEISFNVEATDNITDDTSGVGTPSNKLVTESAVKTYLNSKINGMSTTLWLEADNTKNDSQPADPIGKVELKTQKLKIAGDSNITTSVEKDKNTITVKLKEALTGIKTIELKDDKGIHSKTIAINNKGDLVVREENGKKQDVENKIITEKNIGNQTITYKSNGGGQKVKADNKEINEYTVKLSEGFDFLKDENDNISVTVKENGKIQHKLANNLKEIDSIKSGKDESGAKISFTNNSSHNSGGHSATKNQIEFTLGNTNGGVATKFTFSEAGLDLGNKQIKNIASGIDSTTPSDSGATTSNVSNVLTGTSIESIKNNAVNVKDLSDVAKAIIGKGLTFKGNELTEQGQPQKLQEATLQLGGTVAIESSESVNGKSKDSRGQLFDRKENDIKISAKPKDASNSKDVTLTLELNKATSVKADDERVVTSKAVAEKLMNYATKFEVEGNKGSKFTVNDSLKIKGKVGSGSAKTHQNITTTAKKDSSTLEIALNSDLKGIKSIGGREIGAGKGKKIASSIEFNKQGANGTKPKTNVVIESNGGTFVFDRTGLTLNTKQIKGLASGLGLQAVADGQSTNNEEAKKKAEEANQAILDKVLAGNPDMNKTNAVNVQDLSAVAKAIVGKVTAQHSEAEKVAVKYDDDTKTSITLGGKGTNGTKSSPVAIDNLKSGLGIDDIKDSGIASAAQGKQRELVKKLVSGEFDKDSSHKAVNVADLKAVAQAGLDFAGNDSDSIVHKNLGEKLEIVGQGLDKAKAADFKGTDGNIAVKTDSAKSKLEISLNEELKGLKSAEFKNDKGTVNIQGDEIALKDKDGKTTIATLNDKGLTVGDKDATNGDKTHAVYDKDGLTVHGKDGQSAVSLKVKNENVKGTATLEFAKDGEKGTGAITGLKDFDEKSTGDMAANKNYVDEKFGEVDKKLDEKIASANSNRPFDYYAGEEKVVKGQDGQFYKPDEIKDAKFEGGKYKKGGQEVKTTVKQDDVVIKAEPKTGPMKITNVKDGDLTDKSTDAVNGSQLVKATGAKWIDDPNSSETAPKPKIMVFADGKDGLSGLEKKSDGKESMAAKGLTGKDGLNGKNANDKANALRNGEAGAVVFTDKDGNRLVKANDGKYYKAEDVEDNATPKADKSAVNNPQLSLVNTDGETNSKTDNSVVLGNVASGLGIDADKAKEQAKNVKNAGEAVKDEAKKVTAKVGEMLSKRQEANALETAKNAQDSAINALETAWNLMPDSTEEEKVAKEKAKANLDAEKTKLAELGNELTKANEAVKALQAEIEPLQKSLKDKQKAYQIALATKDDAVNKLLSDKSLIDVKRAANLQDLQALGQAGLNFEGNDGVPVHKNLGEKLTIKGEGEFNSATTAAGNIKVTASDSGMEVKLSDTLKNMTSFETKETAEGNKSRLDGNGLTVTGKNNQSAHYGSGEITLKEGNNKATLTSSALTFTNGQGQKVEIDGAKGEIRVPDLTPNSSPNAVVNKGYVERLQTHTDQKFNHLDNKIEIFNKDLRAGVAGAHAAAALPTVTMPGKSSLALSAGTYKGNNAVALGYSRLSDNGKIMLKLHGSRNSAGDFGGGVGVGWTW